MFHLIPERLHRAGYRAAHALRKIWWRIANPRLTGCRVLAVDDVGRLLLVKPSYGKQRWQFPGGGVAKDEDPIKAAQREFTEETGLQLTDARRLGYAADTLHGASNLVWVVMGRAHGEPQGDGREITEARWFRRDALPDDRSATVDEELLARRADLEEL